MKSFTQAIKATTVAAAVTEEDEGVIMALPVVVAVVVMVPIFLPHAPPPYPLHPVEVGEGDLVTNLFSIINQD